MTESARCSIIIPLLNDGGVVLPLLQSLQVLRAQGHEIIVADGGSEDIQLNELQTLVDQVLICEPGRATQMNRGAAVASGDLLWFVHADSKLDAESAMRQVTDLPGSDDGWGRFDVQLSDADWRLRIVARLMNCRSCFSRLATGDQAMFIRRELFEQAGGFPEIPLMEDIALSRTLRGLARCRCVHSPAVITSSRRWQQQGVLRTVVQMWILRLAFYAGVSPQRLATYYKSCNTPMRAS
ncbi:MAG: TIGR04283 family arsenosugar biosynthesis glycosyltransferase [Chromatiales bacterium]